MRPEADCSRPVPHGGLGTDGVLEAVDGQDVYQVRHGSVLNKARERNNKNNNINRRQERERESGLVLLNVSRPCATLPTRQFT